MILLTAGTLTDPQLPARASNVYTTDARLGEIGRVASAGWHQPGAPPPNPGYAGAYKRSCQRLSPLWPGRATYFQVDEMSDIHA